LIREKVGKNMKRLIILSVLIFCWKSSYCWGFYAHKQINYLAVFLLPPEMMGLYKSNINYLSDHAPDPDKRRYIVKAEAPRHYLDLDHYGKYPFPDLPRNWKDAVGKFSEDSLNAHGIAPWWIQVMLGRLTRAFRDKNKEQVLKLSAEIGHYIADAHVPLHASSNHNGQYTNQQGIHGFWESRIPELLAEKEWDFFMDKAAYIEEPLEFMWDRMLESAAASDTVLIYERKLNDQYSADKKYAFENRNNQLIKQYSKAYSIQYNRMLKGMVERRMRQSVYAVSSFWYTAWSNAGQPKLD
jgi:hypothetical protein